MWQPFRMRLNLFCIPAAALVALFLASVPDAAQAYVGPGAGLTAIGSVLALLAAVGLAIVGFIWYPLKRLIRGKPAAPQPGPDKSEA